MFFDIFRKIVSYLFIKVLTPFIILFFRGLLLFRKERIDIVIEITEILEIRKEYSKGIDLLLKEKEKTDKGDIEAQYQLDFRIAYLLSLNGKKQLAIKLYEKLLEIILSSGVEMRYYLIANLIETYNESEEYEKAKVIIDAYLYQKKSDKDIINCTYFNAGNTFLGLKYYEKAIEYYKNGIESGYRWNYQILYNIAHCYAKITNYKDALRYLDMSCDANKSRKEAGKIKFTTGCIYEEINDYEKARLLYIKAKKFSYKEASKSLEALTKKEYKRL